MVLPTVLILQIEGESGTATELDESAGRPMRLDQFSAVSELVDEARTGEPQPTDVIERLHAILVGHPRFRGWSRVVGHAVLTLGFGLALNPSASALPAYVILGAMVGVLLLVGQRFADAQYRHAGDRRVHGHRDHRLVPGRGSRGRTDTGHHSTPGEFPARHDPDDRRGRTDEPPDHRRVQPTRVRRGATHAARVRRVMGLSVVGNLVDPTLGGRPTGLVGPWLAVFVITVGFVLFQSAPSGSFPWILLMLLITTVAQRAGNNWLTPHCPDSSARW